MTAEDGKLARPCPFCGGAFRMGFEPHDNHPVGGLAYIFHDSRGLGEKWCPMDIGGHFDTGEDAEAFWNGDWAAARKSAINEEKR